MKRKSNPNSENRNKFRKEDLVAKANNAQELFHQMTQQYMVQWHNSTDIEIKQLVEKAINNKTVLAVTFCPAQKDCQWLHLHIYGIVSMYSFNGRLELGNSKNIDPFPPMIVLFKNNQVLVTKF